MTARYTKFFIALGAALAILGSALSDGSVSSQEWVNVAIAFLGSFGVYQFPNKSQE